MYALGGEEVGQRTLTNHEENSLWALRLFFTSESAPLQSWLKLVILEVGNTEELPCASVMVGRETLFFGNRLGGGHVSTGL